MEKKFELTESLINELLNYLASKPWIESNKFISEISRQLQAAAQVQPIPPVEDKKEESVS